MSNEPQQDRTTQQASLRSNMFSSSDLKSASTVEIVIPFHGRYNGVARLMETIMSTVTSVRYHITLVDDGSPNAGFCREISSKNLRGVTCHRLPSKSGFGAAVNHALRNPTHGWISHVCVMHSDALPTDAMWLSNLGSALRRLRSRNVKMVGARSSNFGEDMKHLNTECAQKVDDKTLAEGEYLPMFCAISHRELFTHVGLFEQGKSPRDECREFASRMRSRGFSQSVAGNCWVSHGDPKAAAK